MALMQHVCVSGQQLGKVYYSLPLGFSSPSSSSLGGIEAKPLQQQRWFWRARQEMERASLVLHVLSWDLPWRALEEHKEQKESRFSIKSQHLCSPDKLLMN